MSYFEDLSPHTYSGTQLDAVSIGYLAAGHPYRQGPVSLEILLKLASACSKPTADRFMGAHSCELCPAGRLKDEGLIAESKLLRQVSEKLGAAIVRGTPGAMDAFLMLRERIDWLTHRISFERKASCGSQFRIEAGGRIYAGPTMILHYIIAHGYKPPDEFLQAVLDMKSEGVNE